MTFSGPSGFVRFSQDVDSSKPSSWDSLANRLWEFGLLMYPALRPDYCSLDQLGDDEWTNVWKLELKHIYWRNVFGPRYVAEYGRDFLLNAPGWKVEELEDGGIMYMPEQSYLCWVSKPTCAVAEEAIKYFRKRFPKIKQYKPKSIRLPIEVDRMVLTKKSGEEEVVYKRQRHSKSDRKRNPRKDKHKPGDAQ
jgi:hypothetical protein